jgi:hypothetical protein
MSATANAILLAVVAVAFVAIVVWMVVRRRPGGYGPPIKLPALTRGGRERTNRSYARHGWAKPYDEDGNLIAERDRTPPDRPGGP